VENIKKILNDLERIENIEIVKNPLSAVPKEKIEKALKLLEEFSQELTTGD
jgi:hypothetical protein